MKRTCEHCGAAFDVVPAEVKRGNGKFCSRECGKWSPRRLVRGGRAIDSNGYVYVNGRLAGSSRENTREHVVVAERAFGKALPTKVVVHHFNDNRSDNRNDNLVICQDQSYHMLLHALRRVQLAGGRPFLDRICSTCRAVKSLTEFSPRSVVDKSARGHNCKPCAAGLQLKRKAEMRATA